MPPYQRPRRGPYEGRKLSIVIAIDIGTTFSGASYALLRPDEVPETQGVARFKGAAPLGGDTKIPSIVYYHPDGRFASAGSEDTSTLHDAESGKWKQSKHFKLQLNPSLIPPDDLSDFDLPLGKTAENVFADFLKYMFDSVVQFIKDSQVDGGRIWDQVKDSAQYILTHPNAWGGLQQQIMRECAVRAGMITRSEEDWSRLCFLTEGEASLHWCLCGGLGPTDLALGDTFIVADAGGGTLDFSSYQVHSVKPLSVTEIAVSDCRFAGSIFVNGNAKKHIMGRLKGSGLEDNENVQRLTNFELETKRTFNDERKAYWLSLGGWTSLPQHGVIEGKLKVAGTDLARYYRRSVREIVSGILNQRDISKSPVKTVWLVGGFAASPWLFNQLKMQLSAMGISVYRPDGNTSKAVADGALEWHFNCFVFNRIARLTCGLEYNMEYDPLDPDQRDRPTFRIPSGKTMVGQYFHAFLKEGTVITGTEVYSRRFYRDVERGDTAFHYKILRYTGSNPSPRLMYTEPNKFVPLCTVVADLSRACGTHNERRSLGHGRVFYHIEFVVEVTFGLAEFTARIRWMENRMQRSGPAAVIFEH